MVKEILKIAVLYGGVSAEREISIKSGKAVAGALKSLGHIVHEIDIKSEDDHDRNGFEADIFFIAMHGGFGEDGGIQSILEQKGLIYTGSGPTASAFAMDKVKAKFLFRMHSIQTPDFIVVNRADGQILQKIKDFGAPFVVKPRASGSSLGVSILFDFNQIDRELEQAFFYDEQILIERYIQGREITVGILCDEVLVPIELRPARQFFDYDAKYHDKKTQYIIDPPMDQATKDYLKSIALKAHKALGCSCFSRVDMIYSEIEGRAYVLEVNTIPGLTDRSLLPMAAKYTGIDFPSLCFRPVEQALKQKLTAISQA